MNKVEHSREAFIRRCKERYWVSGIRKSFNTNIGEIYEIDFGENIGSEFSGRHLALCISNTSELSDRMTVIPLTSRYVKYNISELIVTKSHNGKSIKAGLVFSEVKNISKLRVFKESTILGKCRKTTLPHVAKITISPTKLRRYRELWKLHTSWQ